MKKICVAMAVALLSLSGWSDNLVPEDKRDFAVPFKGEGKMSLVYTPVFFPKTPVAVVVSGEVKYDEVVKGRQNWFDARIMTDFITSECKKLKGGPAIGGWKGTADWTPFRKTMRVPDGAAGIALMPCLFNVTSGSMSVRNLSVEPRDIYEEDPADKAKREAYERRKAANAAKTRERAKLLLESTGSLIPAPKNPDEPFCSLKSVTPGKMVNAYREYV